MHTARAHAHLKGELTRFVGESLSEQIETLRFVGESLSHYRTRARTFTLKRARTHTCGQHFASPNQDREIAAAAAALFLPAAGGERAVDSLLRRWSAPGGGGGGVAWDAVAPCRRDAAGFTCAVAGGEEVRILVEMA